MRMMNNKRQEGVPVWEEQEQPKEPVGERTVWVEVTLVIERAKILMILEYVWVKRQSV